MHSTKTDSRQQPHYVHPNPGDGHLQTQYRYFFWAYCGSTAEITRAEDVAIREAAAELSLSHAEETRAAREKTLDADEAAVMKMTRQAALIEQREDKLLQQDQDVLKSVGEVRWVCYFFAAGSAAHKLLLLLLLSSLVIVSLPAVTNAMAGQGRSSPN